MWQTRFKLWRHSWPAHSSCTDQWAVSMVGRFLEKTQASDRAATPGSSLPAQWGWIQCMWTYGWSVYILFFICLSSCMGGQCTYCSSYVCQAVWVVSVHLHLHLGFVHPLQDAALHQCLPSSSVCCFPNPGGSLLLCYVILPSSAWSSSRTYCSSYVCQVVWVVSTHTVLHMSVKLYGWSVYILFFICLSSCMGGQCTYCSSYVCPAVFHVIACTICPSLPAPHEL